MSKSVTKVNSIKAIPSSFPTMSFLLIPKLETDHIVIERKHSKHYITTNMDPRRNDYSSQQMYTLGGPPRPRPTESNRPERSIRDTAPAPSHTAGSMSTHTRRGQPHLYNCHIHHGTRADQQDTYIESTLCRCQDPDSHGDAFVAEDDDWADDKNGNAISWMTAMSRILDSAGKTSLSRPEQLAMYHAVMAPEAAHDMLQGEKEIDDRIRNGEPLVISPYTTWHNIEGRRQPFTTEQRLDRQAGETGRASQGPGNNSRSSRCMGPDYGGFASRQGGYH
jgi:hypothetical protein